MSTGLFPSSTAQGLGARRAQRLRRAETARSILDDFADGLAEHGNVERAASEIGQTDSYGWALFRKLRLKLGWQAS